MKQLFIRLKNKTGETLVETMAAILIFTFGSIIMLSMISSAANINTKVKEADKQYFEDIKAVEMAGGTEEESSILFTLGDRSSTPVTVYVYSGEEDGLYAYYGTSQGGNG